MKYVSTRGGGGPRAFSSILLEGLAPDGGLFVPDAYPQLGAGELARLRPMSYAGLAFEIIGRFADDVPAQDLRRMVEDAYSSKVFRTAEVTPLKTLSPGVHLLGLSNGPTLAFKDLAMQFLGRLFEYVLAKNGQTLNILGATSGDTGSSAEYAMRGRKGVRVYMLSPYRRMSAFQTAQMYSLADPNIFNIAIRGVFDDCQDVVKAVSNDLAFKAKHRIGAVNSINWARIAAQVAYYFKGYFAATRKDGEPVQFAVPTGNFGNILAGHIAKQMGLPIARLILATNENDVLREFFDSGVYRVRRNVDVRATSSPSMDISKASNFERYVHDLVGRDAARLAALWKRVDAEGVLDLSKDEAFKGVEATGLVAGSSTHEERIATMAKTYRDHGVMIDTHTADGVKVGLERRLPGVPLVCLETALPVKFAAAVREALGRDPERPAGYEKLEELPQRFELMDADPAAVKAFIQRTQ